jgi:hypothetical protein
MIQERIKNSRNYQEITLLCYAYITVFKFNYIIIFLEEALRFLTFFFSDTDIFKKTGNKMPTETVYTIRSL